MNKFSFLIIVIFLSFCGCDNVKIIQDKHPLLLADREAPLGWVYLKIYKDKSFEFISAGLRDKTIYSGTYKLNNYTIYFNYKDSIPKAGKKAIITNRFVSYIGGIYPESLEIKLNKLTK